MDEADTVPKLFLQQYKKYGDDKLAVVQKDYGIWQPYTWKEQFEYVKYFSLGLVSLGLEPGDKVSIVGDSDRHWYWSRWAIMAAGGVVVPSVIALASLEKSELPSSLNAKTRYVYVVSAARSVSLK